MATVGNPYCHTAGHHAHQLPMVPDQLGTIPMSIVIPKLPQSPTVKEQQIYQQYNEPVPADSVKLFKTEQYSDNVHNQRLPAYSTANKAGFSSSDGKSRVNRPPSRSEYLKRRPSLREAARSIRDSKVAKRLRRPTRPDFDMEDEDDASVSASESDRSTNPLCRNAASPGYQTQSERQNNVVENLANGMQSSLAIRTHGRGRQSSSASQASSRFMDSSDAASINSSLSSMSSISKRSRTIEDDDPEGEDEEDSDRSHKRPCAAGSLEPEQPQLFACPFAKHDPKRYSSANLEELNYRGCSQSYLTDLARVKQHLYRVHERPQHHCPNCFEVFKNQAQFMKHATSQSCFPRPCPFNEKMSPEQLAAIKKKNRGTDPYLGWYEIYKTLFPGTPLPMSPYATFTATVDTLEAFMDFVMRELPGRLQQQLGFNKPMANAVQGSLPDVLRDIRREFNASGQHKLELGGQDAMENKVTDFEDQGPPHTHNFHQLVTMEPVPNNQMRSIRTSVPEITGPSVYVYPPGQPAQLLSASVASQIPFYDQRAQQDLVTLYPHQQLNYNMQNQTFIQGLISGPPTAIWQPDQQENTHSYFDHQPPTQEALPACTLSIQTEGNWIPHMITTTRMNQPMSNHGIPDLMNEIFQGGYGSHQN